MDQRKKDPKQIVERIFKEDKEILEKLNIGSRRIIHKKHHLEEKQVS